MFANPPWERVKIQDQAYDRMAYNSYRARGEGWVSLLDIAAGAGPRHV